MINASNEGICFEEKTTQHWFTYFKTNPLNIVFHEFSIWLL